MGFCAGDGSIGKRRQHRNLSSVPRPGRRAEHTGLRDVTKTKALSTTVRPWCRHGAAAGPPGPSTFVGIPARAEVQTSGGFRPKPRPS